MATATPWPCCSSAVKRGFAAVGDNSVVTELCDGGLEQAALHGVVIDNEDGTCHG
jgi:hypothetical protein